MTSSTRVGLVMRPIASYRLRDTGYSPFTRDKVVRLLSDLGDEQGILALVELGINSECTDLANQVDLLSFEDGGANWCSRSTQEQHTVLYLSGKILFKTSCTNR